MDKQVEKQTETAAPPVTAKGVHHGAYITKDMDATVDFYSGVLGMPLVVTLALPSPDPFAGNIPQWGDLGGTRHYFFDCGNGDRLAFFSWNESFGEYNPESGVLHHLAFALDTVDDLTRMKEHLEAHGVEVTPVIDHFFCKSIYFKDPNGIYLEYSTYTLPCTEDEPFYEDPKPVPNAIKQVGAERMEQFSQSFRAGHDFVDESNES